ncbi:hypothetical protein LK464_15070 [Mycobacteroides abscessus subsp. abscessus]|nr:hypothetical protein [Mycobacteroides abscessus]UEA22804.1 hypothetical protein LK464_15070 [Mycobacteroides abscessus subsp. abscessus]
MRAAVVGEWVVITGGWSLFHSMREQVLTPETARQAAAWCEGFGDFESAVELRWAAGEAEKWLAGENPGQSDDIVARIDELLSMDSMAWSPMSESEVARILAGEQDERPRPLPVGQIHMIPVEQVDEWTDWWDGLSESDRHDTPWYVMCHRHKTVGERDVPCGCGNPRTDR